MHYNSLPPIKYLSERNILIKMLFSKAFNLFSLSLSERNTKVPVKINLD